MVLIAAEVQSGVVLKSPRLAKEYPRVAVIGRCSRSSLYLHALSFLILL